MEKHTITRRRIIALTKKMIQIKCKKHDYVFQLLPKTHLHGVGCPICEQEDLMEYEQRKQEILEKRMPLEVYLPELNLAIECQSM